MSTNDISGLHLRTLSHTTPSATAFIIKTLLALLIKKFTLLPSSPLLIVLLTLRVNHNRYTTRQHCSSILLLSLPLSPLSLMSLQYSIQFCYVLRICTCMSELVGYTAFNIPQSICSLTYMKVQDAVRQILKLGQGCFLAKIDIDSAFRNVPVHPHDRHLLMVVQPLLTDTCRILNLPLSLPKREGPSTCLVFLSIELDTIKLELRLPADKLERLQSTINTKGKSWNHSYMMPVLLLDLVAPSSAA